MSAVIDELSQVAMVNVSYACGRHNKRWEGEEKKRHEGDVGHAHTQARGDAEKREPPLKKTKKRIPIFVVECFHHLHLVAAPLSVVVAVDSSRDHCFMRGLLLLVLLLLFSFLCEFVSMSQGIDVRKALIDTDGDEEAQQQANEPLAVRMLEELSGEIERRSSEAYADLFGFRTEDGHQKDEFLVEHSGSFQEEQDLSSSRARESSP